MTCLSGCARMACPHGRDGRSLRCTRTRIAGDFGTTVPLAFAQHPDGFLLECVAVDLGFRPVRGIGDDDQQRGQHVVCDQRRTAGRHVGKRQTGQRNDQRDTADHGEHLEGHGEHQAGRKQLAEAVLDFHRGDHAGCDDQQIQHENGHQAGQSQLLAQCRVNVVGICDRGDRRVALTEAGAHQTAGSQAENAGDELV